MPYKYRRICAICGKPNLLNISQHYGEVHQLSSRKRKRYLKITPYDNSVYIPSVKATQGRPQKYKRIDKKENTTKRKSMKSKDRKR